MSEQLQLALPVGTILKDGTNEYKITDPGDGKGFLGQGGFGITYLAREKRLGRDVAIKEFFPNAIVGRGQTLTVASRDKAQFTSLKKYFLGEARFLAGFDDPRIVKVLAFFEANNTAYMVMPYLSGDTVSDRYKTNAFSEAQAETLLLQLIGGLKTVHANGVLHRDIKPDNIKLDVQTDTPILIDFGSARTSEVRGTQSTFGAYSPCFSPIELNSTDAPKTAATDIYSLAATAYRTLFQSGPADAAHRFVQGDGGLPELDAALSKGKISSKFSDVLKKCLELRAEDRFQTLDELEAALGETPRPIPPVPPRRWIYAVAATLVAGVVGAGVWYSDMRGDATPVVEELQDGEADATAEAASDPVEDAWIVAEQQNTIAAYKMFLSRFADSPRATLAAQRIEAMEDELDSAAWLIAERDDTVEGYELYLDSFPNGLRSAEAASKREQLISLKTQEADDAAWADALQIGTKAAFTSYLSEYSEGSHRDEAEDELAWLDAVATDTLESYIAYERAFPTGRHSSEVMDVLVKFAVDAATDAAIDPDPVPVDDPHWIRLHTEYSRDDARLAALAYRDTFVNVQVFENPPGAYKLTLGPYSGRSAASEEMREHRASNTIPTLAFVTPDLNNAYLVDLSSNSAPQQTSQSTVGQTAVSVARAERIAAFQSALASNDQKDALHGVMQDFPGSNEAFLADRLIKRLEGSAASPSQVTESSYSLLLRALTNPEDQSGFELVIDRFPTSPEAVLAQEFLDKMQ